MKNDRLQMLFRPLMKQRERMVLVRIRTSASFTDYVLWIGTAIVCGLAFLTSCLTLLQLMFNVKVWAAWREAGGAFVEQFLGIQPDHVSPPALELTNLCFLAIVMTIFSYSLARKSLREMRGLLAYTTARAAKASVPEQGLVKWEAAPWIEPEVITDPTTKETLGLVEENPEIWETTLEMWRREHPPEPTPLAGMQVHIAKQCKFTLIGQNGKSASFFIKNEKYAEIIAFFATQPHGEWIDKEDFVKKLYGSKSANFYMDIKRLHAEINKVAQAHGLIYVENINLGQANGPATPIQLLEHDKIQGRPCWRLVPGCTVEIFPELQAQYEQAKEAQEQQREVNMEERERVMMDLVQHYGAEEGLMGAYQTKGSWEWIKDAYQHYRAMWLFLLIDTAEREMRRIDENPDTPQAMQSLRDAARLYSWAVAAANSHFPKLALATRSLGEVGEDCLIKALQCYRRLKDRKSARVLYRDYREKHKSDWRPSQAMKDAWPVIFEPVQPKKKAAEGAV